MQRTHRRVLHLRCALAVGPLCPVGGGAELRRHPHLSSIGPGEHLVLPTATRFLLLTEHACPSESGSVAALKPTSNAVSHSTRITHKQEYPGFLSAEHRFPGIIHRVIPNVENYSRVTRWGKQPRS